jgi:hypothetical protein
VIWALIRQPEAGMAALAEVEPVDLEGLATRDILRQAQSLQGWSAGALPDALIERLSTAEAALVQDIARQEGAPADAADCVKTLKKQRYDRERAQVQREIDRLQEAGEAQHEREITALLQRKLDLAHRIEILAHS